LKDNLEVLNENLYRSVYGNLNEANEVSTPIGDFEKLSAEDEPPKVKKNFAPNIIENYSEHPSALHLLKTKSYATGKWLYQFRDLKHTINTLYEAKKHGTKLQTLMSLGIVQMTVTSVLYNPLLSAIFLCALGYTFIKDNPDLKNTKLLLGAGALLFNYISPFIFDPAKSMFLFMSYLYFSLGAFGALTATDEKTVFLSRITTITGMNAFAINDPVLYLGVLTLLEKGYLDDIIAQNAPYSSLYLGKIKETAKYARDDYLLSVTQVTKNSFESVITIPKHLFNFMLDKTIPARDFVVLKQD